MIAVSVLLVFLLSVRCQSTSGPSMFVGHMPNITVSTGREAIFTCVVDNVENFKVAFLRVDTQTILTIDETVITRSARVSVRYSIDKDDRLSTRQRKTWQLSLKEVTSADAGPYMCQLNIEPMVSQVTYLHVTVPPDILVNESSSDLTVTEGENATLKCSATGYPAPNITWRREDYQPVYINQSTNQTSPLGGGIEGSVLNLVGVLRRQMAAYLCIASNGIPPPVSKRILLRVEFAPDVITHQVDIVQRIGEQLVLHCQCQSWPVGFTYWTHEFNRIPSERASIDYRTQIGPAVVDMYLNIPNMQQQDQGNYTCHCSNARGTANRTISVKGIALDPVQQRRMAHSWDAQLPEDEDDDQDEEGKGDVSPSPSARLTTTTSAVSKRQTVADRLARISTTDATTSKTIEANHPTEEMKKRTTSPLLQQQQKRKESNSGVPTSFTSKGPLAISSSRYLYLLLSVIIFLIDNHPLVVAEA